jgi:hypothetical protein
VLTKPSGILEIPLPSDSVRGPESTADLVARDSHAGTVSELTQAYREWLTDHTWKPDRDHSTFDPANQSAGRGYLTHSFWCRPGPTWVVITIGLQTPQDPAPATDTAVQVVVQRLQDASPC